VSMPLGIYSCIFDTTSLIGGRAPASSSKHRAAKSKVQSRSCARRMDGNFLWLPLKNACAHATRFCSPAALELSTALRPVISSNKTTPKLYTSDLKVNCPVMAHSGAQYPSFPFTSFLLPSGPRSVSPKPPSFGNENFDCKKTFEELRFPGHSVRNLHT